MELKNKKYINNTGRLPGYSLGDEPHVALSESMKIKPMFGKVDTRPGTSEPEGSKSGMSFDYNNIGSAIGGTIGLIKHISDSANDYDMAGDLMAQYGNQNHSIMGVNYSTNGDISMSDIRRQANQKKTTAALGGAAAGATTGAAIGSIIPGFGTVAGGAVGAVVGGISGLFSGSHAKRKALEQARIAQRKVFNNQAADRNSALTAALQMENARLYGNQHQQSLYGAAYGVEPKSNKRQNTTKQKLPVITSNGVAIAKANAKVEPGELIVRKDGITIPVPYPQMNMVKNPGDIVYANLKDSDGVLSDRNIDPYTGKTFAQTVKDGDDTAMNTLYRQGITKKAKRTKLPAYSDGWVPNAISSGIGILESFKQLNSARKQQPYKPNTYVANPYENVALTTLAGLRTNPYPIMQQVREQESRTNRAMDMSGGLSGAQRYIGRISNGYGTRRTIADTLANIQQQNNNYASAYASAALNAGDASRRAKMQANQFDLDYYSKAHAAKQKGIQTGTANLLAQIQNYFANQFKYNQWNNTLALYQSQNKQKEKEIKALVDWYNRQ